jgi:hypothetical protein
MSTQSAVVINRHGHHLPRQFKKANRLREQVFTHMDATDSKEFVELYAVLGRYLKEVPPYVREALDRFDYR